MGYCEYHKISYGSKVCPACFPSMLESLRNYDEDEKDREDFDRSFQKWKETWTAAQKLAEEKPTLRNKLRAWWIYWTGFY